MRYFHNDPIGCKCTPLGEYEEFDLYLHQLFDGLHYIVQSSNQCVQFSVRTQDNIRLNLYKSNRNFNTASPMQIAFLVAEHNYNHLLIQNFNKIKTILTLPTGPKGIIEIQHTLKLGDICPKCKAEYKQRVLLTKTFVGCMC